MDYTVSSEHDEIVMKLVHYLITKENYQPIVVAVFSGRGNHCKH